MLVTAATAMKQTSTFYCCNAACNIRGFI